MARETQQEKLIRMTTQPVEKLIGKLALPTIISMVVTSIYNMADTYFVGGIGDSSSATAAVGFVFPLMTIMQAIAFFFGHGSGNYMARELGKGNTKGAEQMATTGLGISIICGFVLTALGLIFRYPVAKYLLQSTDTALPYVLDYMSIIMMGAPVIMGSFVLNNQLRFQGNAFFGMVGIGLGGVLNIALDPLFIYTFDMGILGAAAATVISQVISFLILLFGITKSTSVQMHIENFKPTWQCFKDIFSGGIPSLARQGMGAVAMVILNATIKEQAILTFGFADDAVSAMTIVNKVMGFAASALIGFGQGFQPVCGFNYGAGRKDRVRQAFWFCVKVGFVFLTVLSAIGAIFSYDIVWFFKNSEAVAKVGMEALRLQCIMFPFMTFTVMANMMLQTMGLSGKATFLALSRQGLFLIPCALILPAIFGFTGVLLCQPVADLLSFVLAVPVTKRTLKKELAD